MYRRSSPKVQHWINPIGRPPSQTRNASVGSRPSTPAPNSASTPAGDAGTVPHSAAAACGAPSHPANSGKPPRSSSRNSNLRRLLSICVPSSRRRAPVAADNAEIIGVPRAAPGGVSWAAWLSEAR